MYAFALILFYMYVSSVDFVDGLYQRRIPLMNVLLMDYKYACLIGYWVVYYMNLEFCYIFPKKISLQL
jgi:hypothetical protein